MHFVLVTDLEKDEFEVQVCEAFSCSESISFSRAVQLPTHSNFKKHENPSTLPVEPKSIVHLSPSQLARATSILFILPPSHTASSPPPFPSLFLAQLYPESRNSPFLPLPLFSFFPPPLFFLLRSHPSPFLLLTNLLSP